MGLYQISLIGKYLTVMIVEYAPEVPGSDSFCSRVAVNSFLYTQFNRSFSFNLLFPLYFLPQNNVPGALSTNPEKYTPLASTDLIR
jgi:hypothetical protein